jgi:hypothetical protein
MSAQDNLSPHQFPVYEVGGSEGANYGKRDKVSPEHFGIHHDPDVEWPTISGEHEERRVPLSKVTAGQDYVYKPHVENLATVPAHVLERASEGLPEGYESGDRVLLSHGHHRVAAASKRGDTDALIRVWKSR